MVHPATPGVLRSVATKGSQVLKLPWLAAATSALVGYCVPASAAEVAGSWRVSGKVSSFAFTLDCNFKPAGGRLGGVCVDASTNTAKVQAGKSHPLTAGSVHGDAVTWTYRSSFLLSKFDVTYTGKLAGDRMNGSLVAQGHQGTFTAVRP